MVQTFKEYQLGNHCGHVSYEELEKACFGYIQNIAVLEKRLEIACHIKADDKVGFDFAILDKMDALERERDELKEELRKWRDSRDGMMSIVEKLEADNALLRKRLEAMELKEGKITPKNAEAYPESVPRNEEEVTGEP